MKTQFMQQIRVDLTRQEEEEQEEEEQEEQEEEEEEEEEVVVVADSEADGMHTPLSAPLSRCGPGAAPTQRRRRSVPAPQRSTGRHGVAEARAQVSTAHTRGSAPHCTTEWHNEAPCCSPLRWRGSSK